MEFCPRDVQFSHLRVGDLDALVVFVAVETALHGQSGLGLRIGDQFDDHPMGEERLARQFCVMKANSRCSIRFHLLVPGGRWATVMFSPVSLARRWSSRFHSLTVGPLLPPQSAVMVSRVAVG